LCHFITKYLLNLDLSNVLVVIRLMSVECHLVAISEHHLYPGRLPY